MDDTSVAARQARVYELRPQARDIMPLAGDMNDVFVVDGVEVFRFPKTEAAQHTLQYEASILHRLEGKISLDIPHPLYVAPSGEYAVFSYVPGVVADAQKIAALSIEQKVMLGQSLANFMVELNAALSPEWVRATRQALDPGFVGNPQYFAAILEQSSGGQGQVYELYRQYYQQVHDRAADPSGRQIVVHGDLHVGNLLLGVGGTLRGVIDFGDCEVDTAYSEIRQFYRVDADLAQAIIDGLGGRLGQLDIEGVRDYAIMRELAMLIDAAAGRRTGARVRAAEELLDQWLGKGWNGPLGSTGVPPADKTN